MVSIINKVPPSIPFLQITLPPAAPLPALRGSGWRETPPSPEVPQPLHPSPCSWLFPRSPT